LAKDGFEKQVVQHTSGNRCPDQLRARVSFELFGLCQFQILCTSVRPLPRLHILLKHELIDLFCFAAWTIFGLTVLMV